MKHVLLEQTINWDEIRSIDPDRGQAEREKQRKEAEAKKAAEDAAAKKAADREAARKAAEQKRKQQTTDKTTDDTEKPKQPDDTEQTKTTDDTNQNIVNPVNKEGRLIRSSRSKKDWISPYLLADLQKAVKAAKIGNVEITFASTGHDTGSRHEHGFAVDLSRLNGVGKGHKDFKTLGDILVRELKKLGYQFLEGSNEKSYLWQTNIGGDHYTHVHVSNIKNKNKFDKLTPESKKFIQMNQFVIWVLKQIHEVTTLHPELYFKKFKGSYVPGYSGKKASWLNDNEEGAYAWFIDGFSSYRKKLDEYQAELKPYVDDKIADAIKVNDNILYAKQLVNLISNLIKNGRSNKYTVTYNVYTYDTLKWLKKSMQFDWNYL